MLFIDYWINTNRDNGKITKEKTLDNFKHVKIKNILTGNGLFEWKHIDDFLLNITLEKCEQPLTFKDIYDLYGVKFVCLLYNITQKQIEYISVDNYPELSCLSTIRMVATYLYYFQDIVIMIIIILMVE